MFHLILQCGNNSQRLTSPDFSLLWVREFFLMNESKVYSCGSNMVENMILGHFRPYFILTGGA